MPDLNLQDEGSLENLEGSGELGDVTSVTEEAPEKKGGGMGMILVVILVLLLLGGGAFVLNKLGVVHLWGKKPAPAVVQLPEQQPPQQPEAAVQTAEANQTQMIETPPVDEKGKASSSKKVDTRSAAKTSSKTAAKPPVKEMPAPPAANVGDMKGEFTVQVSAWRDKGIAQEMVKRLGEAGYPAFVEDRAYKGGTWYTVRVGHYASRKDAESAVLGFGDELKSNYWIDRVKTK